MSRPLDTTTDGRTRARWMTTLVDLAALILSMFVLLLATRSPDVPRAPASDGTQLPAVAAPTLEPIGPATTARVGLALAWLRERLRDAALDGRVSARAVRDGIVLEFGDTLALALADPACPSGPGSGVGPLAEQLRGLEPDLHAAILTYAGRGIPYLEDDLRRADLSVACLTQAGLRPRPEPVVAPAPAPGLPRLELRLVVGQP